MSDDWRDDAAQYYDTQRFPIDDVPFYKEHVPHPAARVLELGCGTGRVLIPLAGVCGFIQGIDSSEAMLAICREKLGAAGVPEEQARVTHADITDFDLGERFDLIIAPFRVFQNLESEEQIDGLFRCVGNHLAPGGTCILNVFKPNLDPEALRRTWCTTDEHFDGEAWVDGKRIVRHHRRPRMDPEKRVIYPEIIYRRYDGDALEDVSVLKIAMRCWYPDAFARLITDHGFRIIERWGGYAGEPYGEGPELVVQFTF